MTTPPYNIVNLASVLNRQMRLYCCFDQGSLTVESMHKIPAQLFLIMRRVLGYG